MEQIRMSRSRLGHAKVRHAKVVFAIGRALKGQINNEKRTIFGSGDDFDTHIGPANHGLHF
jgi:hypothetical protein